MTLLESEVVSLRLTVVQLTEVSSYTTSFHATDSDADPSHRTLHSRKPEGLHNNQHRRRVLRR
jgi:hypothetical protein